MLTDFLSFLGNKNQEHQRWKEPWLLENNVDKNALHFAVKRGFLEICKILLDYKLDVNSTDSSGLTTLHIAARDGCLEICKILIGFGADKTLLCNNGKNPLKLAAEKQHFKVVFFLLENIPKEIWIQEKKMNVILDMWTLNNRKVC